MPKMKKSTWKLGVSRSPQVDVLEGWKMVKLAEICLALP